MKKFSIFLLGALAMAATSCEDAPEAPAMQSNPQEPILAQGDVQAAPAGVLAESGTFALEGAPKTVQVVAFTTVDDLPEGATLKPQLQLSNSDSFEKVETLDVTVDLENGNYVVNTNDWNQAHLNLFGKSPKVKTAYYRIPVYIVYGGTEYRYQSPDYYAVAGTVDETCKDAGFVIYDNYYFIGSINGWGLNTDYPFTHSDADVYDDPVFSIKLEITQEILDANGGKCWWRIASEKAVADSNWELVYGPEVDGDDNLSGMLIENGQSGVVSAPGKYRLTINMEEMTYEFAPITRPDYVAVPSNANGWNESGAHLLWSEGKGYFCGAARVNNTDGGFKFIWDGSWFGGANGVIDAAGGNIPAPEDGNQLYWFTVSTEDMTYTMTPITSIGVVGGLNGWDANAPIELKADESLLVWSGEVNLTADWKIIINHSWDSNYGGPDVAELTFDGGNIGGFEGNYTVTVDFSGNKPAVIVAPK